eukprot:4560962-Amphidinium_carterae.1
MAIKTSGKSVVINDSLMRSFHMRRLSVVLDRSSQADSNNLFFNWLRPLGSLTRGQASGLSLSFGPTRSQKLRTALATLSHRRYSAVGSCGA